MSEKFDRTARAEWRAHWPVVLVSTLGIFMGGMQFYTQGMFMAPLQEAFGWTRAEVTLGPTINTIIVAFTTSFYGFLADRVGPRVIVITGLFAYTISFAALGLQQGPLWQWVLLWVILGFTIPLAGPTIWVSAVVSRFSASRGTALAIAFAGNSLCSFAAPVATGYLVANYGWRAAYAIMPTVLFAIVLPLTLRLFFAPRDRPDQHAGVDRASPTLVGLSIRQGLRSSYFWRLVISPALFAFGTLAMIIHFVELVSGQGLDRASAAVAAGMVGVTAVIGRLTTGVLLDNFHCRYIAFTMFGIPLVAVVLLLNYDGTMLRAVIAALALGLALGGEFDILGYAVTRYMGTRFFASFFGILVGLANIFGGLGSYAAGLLYDVSQSYDTLLWLLVPVFLVSALIMLSMGTYPDFTREREEADTGDASGLDPAIAH